MVKRCTQYLRRFWRQMAKPSKVAFVLYSFMGAFCALIGARVVRTEWFYSGNFEQNYFPGLHAIDLLFFIVLFVAVSAVTLIALAGVTYLYKRIPLRAAKLSPRAIFFIVWAILFLCWLPYFFVNFPGIIYADSIVTIKQALGINSLTTHHPLAYTGYIAVCLRLGDALFGSYVAGIAIYTITQMLFISAVCAYFVSWLARRHLPAPALVVVCAVFAMSSIFPIHAASMWKDGVYAALMLLLALRLLDVAANQALLARPTTFVQLAVLTLLVCLARTNGVYAMALVWLGAIFALPGVRAKTALTAACSIAVFACIHFTAVQVFNAQDEPVESYGIALQQTAAVVVYDGTMTQEQRTFLDTMLPLEDYKEEYIPCSVDGIKWADNFNKEFFAEHQAEFMRICLEMAPANMKLYADAYIMESYEYWTFGDVRRNVHVNYVNDKYDAPDLGITETNLFDLWFGPQASALFPYRFVTLGEGVVSWMVLFAFLLLFTLRFLKAPLRAKKNFAHPCWLVLMPAFASWLTVLLSSPFAALPRYVLPSIFLLPVIFLLPWLVESADSEG